MQGCCPHENVSAFLEFIKILVWHCNSLVILTVLQVFHAVNRWLRWSLKFKSFCSLHTPSGSSSRFSCSTTSSHIFHPLVGFIHLCWIPVPNTCSAAHHCHSSPTTVLPYHHPLPWGLSQYIIGPWQLPCLPLSTAPFPAYTSTSFLSSLHFEH